MTPRSTPPPTSPSTAKDGQTPDGAELIVRRAPFSDNPHVGVRGQRTQQRILDSALEVFGEDGYYGTSIDRITTRAGCSRASFYQYFSSKDAVFQHLTGQVARQLAASAEALGPLTPDAAGWSELRSWVGRYAEIFGRYEPVFKVFPAASESDREVATGSARWAERNMARVRAKISTTSLPPRQLDPLIAEMLACTERTQHVAGLLRAAAPDHYSERRVGDALTDVFHRALFGLNPAVNVHPPARRRPPKLKFDPQMAALFRRDGSSDELTPAGRQTLATLMEAGVEVFATRGYHQTRVDDVVAAAGVSHGAFYRYFDNKEHLARVLTARAVTAVSVVFSEIPADVVHDGEPGRAALRRWLRRYNATQTTEAVMAGVWVEASLQDATLGANSAATMDWGRRRMAAFLEPRDFGDVPTEAVVLVAFLSSFGAAERTAGELDAAVQIIERGFLGH